MPADIAFIPDIFSPAHDLRPRIDLGGAWELRRDPDQCGREHEWHAGDGAFPNIVRIPGAPQAQGIGEPHRGQRTSFDEPYWVRRTFTVPALGDRERFWLRIGGIQPAADVYLNGEHVGYTKSSRTPERMDVTPLVRPGAENTIAIVVRELPDVRLDGIWEYAESGTFWSGVWGPVAGEITGAISVVDLYAQPRLATSSVDAWLRLSAASDRALVADLAVHDGRRIIGRASVQIPTGENEAAAIVRLDAYTPWSPNHPALYRLEVALRERRGARPIDRVAVRFGMREIRAEGTKFLLNGAPVYFRGYGDDQLYVETLCPPADPAWFVARLDRARRFGMNVAKGCIETLPPSYLEAADEVGMMVIQEMPFGLSGLRANRHAIDDRFREYYRAELDGLVRTSRNHASVIGYSITSELGFAAQTPESFAFFNQELPDRARALAPHALVIDCTGYVDGEDTNKGMRHTDFYASCVAGDWAREVLDERAVPTDRKHPLILHEWNWWGDYPDPASRAKYAGAQVIPYWLDDLERTAGENGQADLVATCRRNTSALQALCRKEGIEFARRNPDVEGFLLWLLIDYGRWCEGLFDDFWDEKPNATAEDFLASTGDTVIVLAADEDRCVATGKPLAVPFAISHYGEEPLEDCTLRWEAGEEETFAAGEIALPHIARGGITQAGAAEIVPPPAGSGYRFTVRVALLAGGKTTNTNRWSFWAFPETADPSVVALAEGRTGMIAGGALLRVGPAARDPISPDTDIVVATEADEPLADWIARGGRCIFLAAGTAVERPRNVDRRSTFYDFYRTIPWNQGTTGNSGTVIADHPALDRFPHGSWCDLQFLRLISRACPMDADWLRPHGVEPIVRGIDHFLVNRNNAWLVEFAVGAGRVVATTFGLLPNLAEHVEARAFLDVLLAYARGDRFAPTGSVPREEFVARFAKPSASPGSG